jgi:hypothetical protein
VAFRPDLTAFREAWEKHHAGLSRASDGYLVVQAMRVPRSRKEYPQGLQADYESVLQRISQTLEMPIRHAGPGKEGWSVFPRPGRASALSPGATWVPGTVATDRCLLLPAELWQAFADFSLWVEALCVHEWCLFTESVEQPAGGPVTRGEVFAMLTESAEERRPLSWERKHIDQLLRKGESFECPWTGRRIKDGTAYDVDHLVPISIYPANEMWNLVPSDRDFNQHVKKDRMPTTDCLAKAEPRLASTYRKYLSAEPLAQALREDAALRFAGLPPGPDGFPEALVRSVVGLVGRVTEMRNLARFQSGGKRCVPSTASSSETESPKSFEDADKPAGPK